MLGNLKIIWQFHAHPVHQKVSRFFGPRYIGDDFLLGPNLVSFNRTVVFKLSGIPVPNSCCIFHVFPTIYTLKMKVRFDMRGYTNLFTNTVAIPDHNRLVVKRVFPYTYVLSFLTHVLRDMKNLKMLWVFYQ